MSSLLSPDVGMGESVGPVVHDWPHSTLLSESRGLRKMFEKAQLDAVFGELDREWRGKPEFEKLSRETHLGIALWDAGRPLDKIDPRAVALIEKHKPKG